MQQHKMMKQISICGDFDCGLLIEDACTDLEDETLPFIASPELRARFDAWVDDYSHLIEKADIDEKAWSLNEQEGRMLAREIKKLAGSDIEVVYGPSWESTSDYGSMPAEVME